MNTEQTKAFHAANSGKNVFITGSGGTGKTFWIHQFCKYQLQSIYNGCVEKFKKEVVVLAPTGVAAVLIGGSTLNSSLGIGIPTKFKDFDKMCLSKNKSRVCGWKIALIDEISMVSKEFLGEMNKSLKVARKCDKPFGGIQIICIGDFYQLPPVQNKIKSQEFQNSGYAFQSDAWKEANFINFVFTEPFRQQQDTRFSELLNKIRSEDRDIAALALADIAAECSNGYKSKHTASVSDNDINPTKIFALNVDVDKINNEELEKLGNQIFTFKAVDEVDAMTTKSQKERILKSNAFFSSDSTLRLAVGAQVMLTKNLSIEEGLINGSRGVIVAIDNASSTIHVKFLNGKVIPITIKETNTELLIDDEKNNSNKILAILKRKQLPLKLAWALTVHKSQGLTLDKAVVTLRSMFAAGHVYVALSRVKSLEGLEISDIPPPQRLLEWAKKIVKIDPIVQNFYKELLEDKK